jgi:hypothetical protein
VDAGGEEDVRDRGGGEVEAVAEGTRNLGGVAGDSSSLP